MKLFLILCVVLGGVWLWRMNRRAASQQAPAPAKEMAASALEVVHCDFCSLHVPHTEAIQGKKGLYCSLEHQHLAEP